MKVKEMMRRHELLRKMVLKCANCGEDAYLEDGRTEDGESVVYRHRWNVSISAGCDCGCHSGKLRLQCPRCAMEYEIDEFTQYIPRGGIKEKKT